MASHPWRIITALLAMLAAGSCSKSTDSGPGFAFPKLSDSEPYRTPKYPDRAAVQPSVQPSAFNSGPAYDWEIPVPKPPNMNQWMLAETFSNTRTFDETSAWIKKAMETYIPSNRPPEANTRFADFHFRGCIFEWHEEVAVGSD